MDTAALGRRFGEMGARVRVEDHGLRRGGLLDIQKDKKGEIFVIGLPGESEAEVVNIEPKNRHLLILIRNEDGKHKFLCGHDERQWFAAAVPGPATTVRAAMEALKPAPVRQAQAVRGVHAEGRQRRHNKAYIRQGEWFFMPDSIQPDPMLILRNEPILRAGGGKPHMCERLYRVGGEAVHVHFSYAPNGLTGTQFKARSTEVQRERGWRNMRRGMQTYVCGRITHPDHATVVLKGWHRVVPNTEDQARSRRFLTFLD